tara:strand:- start:5820 stop:6452 length:633 start_codon:yes stop_codon:yes gene_type:complete
VKTVFWDVDTQVDFISPDGKLYVDGSEEIRDNLARLTTFAREAGRIVACVDYHTETDPEISDQPDFIDTFPPHCLIDNPGQLKIEETTPADPFWVDPDPIPQDVLRSQLDEHTGDIIFRKRRFDVFTNPNVDIVLDLLAPDKIVLYGVALDVCNRFAIDGLLEREVAPISLVLDATRAIDPARGDELVDAWQSRGVAVVSTADVVSRNLA